MNQEGIPAVHGAGKERIAGIAEGDSVAARPRRGQASRSSAEALLAPVAAESRLCRMLRELESLRAENRRLRLSLEAASTRATTAQRIARHDGLTGLPNRLFLIERLQRAVAVAHQRSHRLALLFIDLDGFKAVNDGFGHAVADRLLAAVASRIAASVRTDDIACRYGGDEFVVLLTNLGYPSIEIGVAQKIREHIAECYTISGHEIRITASIGLAIYPDHGDRWGKLLSHADAAMYRDKAARCPGRAAPADSATAGNRHLDEMLSMVVDERDAAVAHIDSV